MQKVSTTSKATKKRSLASSKVALRGIEDLNPTVTVLKETASVIPFLIKTVVILGIGYYVYNRFTNRFIAKKEVKNYPVANVSTDQAKSRADAIYNARSFFGIGDDQFNLTAQNLAGLNYNGFIRVYNEFGHRTSYTFSGDMDLIGFLQDQFTNDHLQQLSTLLNGAFFKVAELTAEQQQIKNEFFPSLKQ